MPYENLDVQFGRRVTLDVADAYAKIVEGGRGGWCYEMNALFAWALREIGFEVTFVAAGVGARERPENAFNHLALLVALERPMLADVGFGNGFLTPLALAPGSAGDGRFTFRLERIESGWRFHNHATAADTYDFTETPRSIGAFAAKSAWLQRDPESPFVQNLVCHRFTDEGIVSLRGAVLTTLTPHEVTETIAQSAAELAEMLRARFALAPDDADALWERVAERHRAWVRHRVRGF
ncbi:MAG: arylamine N-acetyltransferase [bacterium]|nr:arylamine N-acetyltransferase [bacterium]